MIIELQRAFTPEEMFEEECGICGVEHRRESVIAQAATDGRTDMGGACPACVEMLGRRNPYRFPTLQEFEAAKRRYPEPMWKDEEEADLALEEGGRKANERSWIWRSPDARSSGGRQG